MASEQNSNRIIKRSVQRSWKTTRAPLIATGQQAPCEEAPAREPYRCCCPSPIVSSGKSLTSCNQDDHCRLRARKLEEKPELDMGMFSVILARGQSRIIRVSGQSDEMSGWATVGSAQRKAPYREACEPGDGYDKFAPASKTGVNETRRTGAESIMPFEGRKRRMPAPNYVASQKILVLLLLKLVLSQKLVPLSEASVNAVGK